MVEVSNLTGAALDWAVAKCEGLKPYVYNNQCVYRAEPHGGGIYFRPSTDWAQGGPIIERERIDLHDIGGSWSAGYYQPKYHWHANEKFGPTPLIAAMRCYVASKLGDEIKIPKELLND